MAVYTLTEITVHKGDKVTIHFINAAEEAEDRHTFTMEAPYKMDYDLAGASKRHSVSLPIRLAPSPITARTIFQA